MFYTKTELYVDGGLLHLHMAHVASVNWLFMLYRTWHI